MTPWQQHRRRRVHFDDPEQTDTKQGSRGPQRREEDGLRPDLRREAEERLADRRREVG